MMRYKAQVEAFTIVLILVTIGYVVWYANEVGIERMSGL